jgi:hypothetical protein
MFPQPSPRINTVIAASYRPEEDRPRKKSSSSSKASVMADPPALLPIRSRSSRTSQSSHSTSSSEPPPDHRNHNTSTSTSNSNSNPKSDPRGERTLSNPSPAAVARAARPSVTSRTSSAPSIPQSRDDASQLDDDNRPHDEDEDDHDPGRAARPDYRSRDSVASIKDDPFFRHYQTPQSMSMGRELMSATYEHEEDEEAELVSPLSPPPRSTKKPAVDESVNLPVSCSPVSLPRWESTPRVKVLT